MVHTGYREGESTNSHCKFERKFYEHEELEYPNNYRRRKVNNRGYIIIKGQQYFIGNPFTSYYVGFRPIKTGELKVWFGNALICSLDEKTKLLIPEKRVINKGRRVRQCYPCLEVGPRLFKGRSNFSYLIILN